MSARTCPFQQPSFAATICPLCGATADDKCLIDQPRLSLVVHSDALVDATAARDRLAAENARLKATLVDLLGWFDADGMFNNYRGGAAAAFSARVDAARALLEKPDA